MDRDEVKKLLIAILNLKPNGIYADDIKKEFKREAGSNIPFGGFGYDTLLEFLENELNDNIRIDKGNRLNFVVYPIATKKSGHILKLKSNEDTHRR